jgi:hypothetical protein
MGMAPPLLGTAQEIFLLAASREILYTKLNEGIGDLSSTETPDHTFRIATTRPGTTVKKHTYWFFSMI